MCVHIREALAPARIADPNSPEGKRFLDRFFSPEPLANVCPQPILWQLSRTLDHPAAGGILAARKPKTDRALPAAILGCLACWPVYCLPRAALRFLRRSLALACSLPEVSFGTTAWMVDLVRRWSRGGGHRGDGLARRRTGSGCAQRSAEFRALSAAVLAKHKRHDRRSTALRRRPGNFKSVYPHYKLPQASEEIGDPHNFMLEIAASVGLPGLLLFLALIFSLLFQRGRAGGGT